MKKSPIEVRVDPEVKAAYVRYTSGEVDETLDVHPTGAVTADVDAAGDVIGIEILAIDDSELLTLAARYAAEHGLGFPRNLAGALPA